MELTCIDDGITEPQHQSISGRRQPSNGLSAHQSVASYRLGPPFFSTLPSLPKSFFPWPWPKPALFLRKRRSCKSHLHKWHISSVHGPTARFKKTFLKEPQTGIFMTSSSHLLLSCIGCIIGTVFESGCVTGCSISPCCPFILGDGFGLFLGPE